MMQRCYDDLASGSRCGLISTGFIEALVRSSSCMCSGRRRRRDALPIRSALSIGFDCVSRLYFLV